MDEENAAMERTKTWDLVSLHAGHHAIGFMWVYCVKYNLDVSVDRYKARLVAKGYNQLEGIDFLDMFSPVAKIVTVKVFLTISTSFAWPTQIDINNTFGLLSGFKVFRVSLWFVSLISLCGFKQDSRQWFQWFSKISAALLASLFFSI